MKRKRYGKQMACIAATVAVLAAAGCSSQTAQKTGDGETLELRYWCELKSYPATVVNNLGETPLFQKLQEATNTKITFEHPPQGQVKEKFNIMVASDDLPDVIAYNWKNYGGGPEKAIADKLIVDLNEYKSAMPNLTKYLSENDEARKQALTDSGQLFSFPFIRGDESLRVSNGLIVRQDWLDDLGLDMPETLDEWETVLTAFRDKKGAKAPLSLTIDNMYSSASFVGAFNTNFGFHVNNGQVKYGQATPEFKEFLVLMNDWYKKGLLDKDFATLDDTTRDSNVLNGAAGAVTGSIGQHIGRYMSAADNKFNLAGAPVPVKNKGDLPEFGYLQNVLPGSNHGYVAISVDCKNKERVASFLDYGYSEEGRMLFNFGIEGESYSMVDGYPTYTDLITSDPNNSMTVQLSQYTMAYDAGPFVQDKRYMEQYAQLPQQKRAWEVWTKTNMKEHVMPPIYLESSEMNEISALVTSVETYAREIVLKTIMGIEPIENYDNAIAEMKKRGIDTVLKSYQAAYERYMNR